MRHFATTEPKCDFHFVAVLKELVDVAHFNFVIIGVRVGTEFDFLDLNDLLFLAGLRLTLLRLVLKLAEIHDLTNRWIGVWRDFNQIQASLFGHDHCTGWCYNTHIVAVCADQANFGIADLVIDAWASVTLWRRVMWSASDEIRPLVISCFYLCKVNTGADHCKTQYRPYCAEMVRFPPCTFPFGPSFDTS